MLTVQTNIRVLEPVPATEPEPKSRTSIAFFWLVFACLSFPFWLGAAEIIRWIVRAIWG